MATGLPRLQAPADRIVATAGLSGKVSGAWLIGFSLVLAGCAFVAWMALMGSGGFDTQEMLIGAGATALGGIGPWIVLSSRGKRRQDAIDRALPDVLDLLTVSIEAGLAMEGALQRVSQRESGALHVEIRRTLNEIALGRRRSEALTAMAQRTEVPPLQTLVSAINQAERTGLQMGPVMRAQSEQIRIRRRQLAEEKAMKAPVKMLFPLIGFIFPSMFIVILGPAAISFTETFGG
jgi:tight adherence protein C